MTEWFWVVFDTSQKRDYYRDVHNVLAHPAGAVMRYDYQQSQIAKSALQHLADPKARILFVYTQMHVAYNRTENASEPSGQTNNIAYVGTRIGRMEHVANNNGRYHFDFVVAGYPEQNGDLESLMAHLDSTAETPLSPNSQSTPAQKYVCVSTNTAALNRIVSSDDQKAWTTIVQLLSAPPMQFSQDIFWRLKGPYAGKHGTISAPSLLPHKAGNTVSQIESIYQVTAGSNQRFELLSCLGVGGGPAGTPQVEVTSTNEELVRIVGSTHIFLRRYTATNLDVRGHSFHLFGTSRAELNFETFPQAPNGWVTGPTFKLAFNVRRSLWRYGLGVLIGIFGVVVYAVGDSKVLECYGWWPTIFRIVGTLLLAVSAQLMFGKLSFSGK